MSVILLDSIFRIGKNYYPQVLLEEYKCVIKEKNIHSYIIDDVEISSDSDEETLLEKIQMEKYSNYEENWGRSGKNSDGKKFWWTKF